MYRTIALVIGLGSVTMTGCMLFRPAKDPYAGYATKMQAQLDKVHPAKVVPAQNFPEAQKLGLAAADASGQGRGATIHTAYPIYGMAWQVKRDPTGHIVSRDARIMVVYQRGDDCRQQDTNVKQQYMTTGWGSPVLYPALGYMAYRIRCADVNKFPFSK